MEGESTFVSLSLFSELGEVNRIFASIRHLWDQATREEEEGRASYGKTLTVDGGGEEEEEGRREGSKRIDRYRLMVQRIPFEQSGQRVIR